MRVLATGSYCHYSGICRLKDNERLTKVFPIKCTTEQFCQKFVPYDIRNRLRVEDQITDLCITIPGVYLHIQYCWAPNRPYKNSKLTLLPHTELPFVNIYVPFLYPHLSHSIVGLNITT